MFLNQFIKNICVNETSTNRKIKIVFANSRSFITTAKELKYCCENNLKLATWIGGELSNFIVISFRPAVLTDKDKELPVYNRSIVIEVI